MSLIDMFNRGPRRNLLIEVNPYQILAAGITQPDANGPMVLDCAAEFANHDDAGLRNWLDANFEKQKTWVPAIVGFTPPDALLQRESILPRKLAEPAYLHALVTEQYRIEKPSGWKLFALSPLEGVPLLPEGTQRPALVCGVSNNDVHHIQQRMLDHRLLPYRLETGLLPLFGAIANYNMHKDDKRAVVIVVIEQEHTIAYILGKEGVHTPAPVRHGFSSIVQATRKEFNLSTAAEVRERLHHPDEELLLRASKLVRTIARDLKPLVDSYEMTTGQPIGELYCAYLPPQLNWLAEPLAQVVGRASKPIDCTAWMPTVNLVPLKGIHHFGPNWLSALSLIADISETTPDKTKREDSSYAGPWHIDCRLSAELPSDDLIRRRFLANVIVSTLAAAALMFTFWQLYAAYVLGSETAYWEQRIVENQKPFDDYNLSTRNLGSKTARIDQAYAIMGQPYVVSDFIANLGRTRPAAMVIDSIESNDTGVIIRGKLGETSQQASRSLRGYVEDMRRDPTIGPLFIDISLTSIERQETDGIINFEIRFKLKQAAQP